MTRKTSQDKTAPTYRPSPAQYVRILEDAQAQAALLASERRTIVSLTEQIEISKRQGESAMEQLLESQQQNATQRARIETLQQNLEAQSDNLSAVVKEFNKQSDAHNSVRTENAKLRDQNSALIIAVKTLASAASATAESLPD